MMLHEIAPERFEIVYRAEKPEAGDRVLLYRQGEVLAEVRKEGEDGEIRIPLLSELPAGGPGEEELLYFFSAGGKKYFAGKPGCLSFPEGTASLSFFPVRFLRRALPVTEAYAAAVGYQLFSWYRDNRFCPRCGGRLLHSAKERALICPDCGYTVFPRINPSVIVGVLRGEGASEELLVTRYNPSHVSDPNMKEKRSYGGYALVAGYIETGESAEMTVEREVMEEVGLRVSRIRPWKTQPWPFSSSLLLGYLCEAEKTGEIVTDRAELSEALWVKRAELPDRSADRSLTSCIMEAFRRGEI